MDAHAYVILDGVCWRLCNRAVMHEQADAAAVMWAAGATAYVAKTSAPEQLLAAIRSRPAE